MHLPHELWMYGNIEFVQFMTRQKCNVETLDDIRPPRNTTASGVRRKTKYLGPSGGFVSIPRDVTAVEYVSIFDRPALYFDQG